MHEAEHNLSPEQSRLGLVGPMESFEGTAFAPFIDKALEDAGIDPMGYNPKRFDHYSYYGLLATEPSVWDDERRSLSPVVAALNEAVERGDIAVQKVKYGTVRHLSSQVDPSGRPTGIAHLTSKLSGIGILECTDAASGEVLCYADPLSSDGGTPGYAILSTNDVSAGHEPY